MPSAKDRISAVMRALGRYLVRLLAVFVQMLAFHRHSLNPAAVNLGELLDLVLDLYSPLTRSAGISLVRRYEGDNTVCAFPDELHEVFANIIRNAIEVLPEGGTIRMYPPGSQRYGLQRFSAVRNVGNHVAPRPRPIGCRRGRCGLNFMPCMEA